MTIPNPDQPEFAVPLNKEQLEILGRVTATWSQIDYLIAMAIAVVTNTAIGSMFLFTEGMMLGARVNLLRKLMAKMPSDDTKFLTKSICDRLGKLVDRRNHILHGIWGWHVDKGAKRDMRPACYNGRNKDAPVFGAELADLLARATNESRQLGILLRKLNPNYFDVGVAPRKFLFGEGPPPGPIAKSPS